MHTSAVCLCLFGGSRPEPSGFEGSALSLFGGDAVFSGLSPPVLVNTWASSSGLVPVPVSRPQLGLL